jgi:O-antigen biosynthesis protein
MTAGRPLVSVVVPCHNYGRFLAEAVESIERQTRPADEVVVVDDGSTDETSEVVERLRRTLRTELVVVSRHPARGAAQTFNDGVLASRGDLVVILSADDRLSDRYLELTEEALADPEVTFAYAEARMFGVVDMVQPAPSFSARELARGNYVNGSAMFRRSLFDAVGGFKRDLRWEDWEFWLHAVERGATGRPVPGCWLDYRRHPEGSRDTMTRWDALGCHFRLHALHPGIVRPSDIGVWLSRSLMRRLGLAPARSQP